jgi:hypothetical protein
MIEFTTELSEADYVAGNWLSTRPYPWIEYLQRAALFLSLLFLTLNLPDWLRRELRWVGLFNLVFGFLVIMTTWILTQWVRVRQTYRQLKRLGLKKVMRIDEEGLSVTSDRYTSIMKWGDIIDWKHSKDYVVVSNGTDSQILPKRRFHDTGALDNFLARLRDTAPLTDSALTPRTVLLLAIWLTIVLLLALLVFGQVAVIIYDIPRTTLPPHIIG